MKRLCTYILLGLTALTGCQSDSEGNSSQIPITLRADMNTTRAVFDLQNAQFETGERIAVYMEEVVPAGQLASTTYAQPVYYTTQDNAGALGPSGTAYPYYPLSGNKVSLYALYPSTGGKLNQNSTSFTVEYNQHDPVYYKLSDFLFTAKNDTYGITQISKPTTATDPPYNIHFYHMLSRIQVELHEGTGAPNLTGAQITLKSVYRKVNFTAPSTGTVTLENMTGYTATANDKGPVIMTTYYDLTDKVSAVVVPQTLPVGDLFEIQLGNDVLTFEMNQSLTLQSGLSYKFDVTVNHNSVEMEYTVTNWDESPVTESINGNNGDVVVIKQ